MIATSFAPKTSLSRKIRRIARRSRPLQVKASDVDSYGDYDVEQMNALPVNPVGAKTAPDVAAEDFERLYHWYLS
jgi:hypothetical protein